MKKKLVKFLSLSSVLAMSLGLCACSTNLSAAEAASDGNDSSVKYALEANNSANGDATFDFESGEAPVDGELPELPEGEAPTDGELPPELPNGEAPADGELPPELPEGEAPTFDGNAPQMGGQFGGNQGFGPQMGGQGGMQFGGNNGQFNGELPELPEGELPAFDGEAPLPPPPPPGTALRWSRTALPSPSPASPPAWTWRSTRPTSPTV